MKYSDETLLAALREAGGAFAGAAKILQCGSTTYSYAIKQRRGFLAKVAHLRAELVACGQLNPRVTSSAKGNKSRRKKARTGNPKGSYKPPAKPCGEIEQIRARQYGRGGEGGDKGEIVSTPLAALARACVLAERVNLKNWSTVYAAMICELAEALRRFPADSVKDDFDG